MGRMDGSMDVCPYIISMAGERERSGGEAGNARKRATDRSRKQTENKSAHKIYR